MAKRPKDLELADKLECLMDKEAELQAELDPIQQEIEDVRTELTKYLLSIGREYTRTTSGLGLGIVRGRVTFAVKKGMEDIALEWAKKEYPAILSIAAAKLNKVVQPLMELPEFIERKQGEPHLSVRASEEGGSEK